ncbi:MAG: PepSY-associated TM helix domain-containing protein [Porphyromonas sp.]|nr:PepSY-associated TM helix domain-containing protein [Porphyromonas sp.]
MRSNNIRKWAARLHLYLGLPAGLVLFVVALTGAIYALRPEVVAIGRPDLSIVDEGKDLLPPYQLIDGVRSTVYRSPADSSNLIYGVTYEGRTQAAQVTAKIGNSRRSILFVNPYTGQLLHTEHSSYDIFRWAMNGHRSLWLPREIGKPIIGWSILAFIIVSLTGLVIWMPRKLNKKSLRAVSTIKWGAKRPRLFLDLHNVVGIYTLAFALAIAVTGLTWSFDWWANGYYGLLTGGDTLETWVVPKSDVSRATQTVHTDSLLWQSVQRKYPIVSDGSSLRFDVPTDEDGVYTVVYNPDGDLRYSRTEYNFYDRYTLQQVAGGGLYGIAQDKLSIGQRIYRMTYDIHSGSIGGWVGRYIAFFVSLALCLLPITGIYLWWRKRKAKV